MRLNRGLALLAAVLAFGAAAQNEPGAFELEMWRAASRLDVKEGYDSYLAQFPRGAFAEMARAALKRFDGGGGGSAAVAPRVDLSRLQSDNPSRAMVVQPGERLAGPGVVSVGWFGAKRQLVVPAGEWIVLDTFDHDLRGTITTELATVVLARLRGNAVASVLVVTFNRRSTTQQTGMFVNGAAPTTLLAWPAAAACEAPGDGLLHREIETSMRRLRTCSTVRPTTAADRWPSEIDPLPRERLRAALHKLGVPLPAMAARTDVQMSGPAGGYMGYNRFDDDATPAARVDWVRRFTPLAIEGFHRNFDDDDLVNGEPPRRRGDERLARMGD